jgi:heptosyltransferase-1
MRILVIRLSALGDIVHALPALTDLRRALPEAHIDFAVDERFVDVARLHGGVNQVVSIPLKRWKRHLGSTATWRELGQTLSALRRERYDLVLDLHGLNKSALVALAARTAVRIGPDPRFCGEWLGPKIYHRFCTTQGSITPVPRMRAFVADALGQTSQAAASYGLRHAWQGPSSEQVLLIHSTSATAKLWPDPHWVALGQMLIDRGLHPLLPWGSPSERERSERLAQAMGAAARVAPQKTILEWTAHFSQTRMVVGVDTGLTHLAAACAVPCIAIFCATGANLFAPQEAHRALALGDLHQPPSLEAVVQGTQDLLARTATDAVAT